MPVRCTGSDPGAARSYASSMRAAAGSRQPSQRPQKFRALRAVDHPMIAGERHPHAIAHHYLAVDHHRFLHDGADRQAACLGRIEDRGELIDAEHPEVRDGEGASLVLVGASLLFLAFSISAFDSVAIWPSDLLIGVADHRNDRDRRSGIATALPMLIRPYRTTPSVLPAGIHVRMLRQRQRRPP